MKKWLWVTGAVLIVLVGGGWYSVKQIEQSVATSVVSKVLSNPSIKKELDNINVSQITTAIQSVTQAQTEKSSAVSPSGTSLSTDLGQGRNSSSNPASPALSQKAGTTGSTAHNATSAGQVHPSSFPTSSTSSTSTAGNSGQGSTKSGGGSTQKPSTGSSNIPVFTSRQQVISYALSHFSASQIVHFAILYLHKSHLTPADLKQIQDELLSHFSTSQLSAMATAWNAHP